jgi:hypothetical protein
MRRPEMPAAFMVVALAGCSSSGSSVVSTAQAPATTRPITTHRVALTPRKVVALKAVASVTATADRPAPVRMGMPRVALAPLRPAAAAVHPRTALRAAPPSARHIGAYRASTKGPARSSNAPMESGATPADGRACAAATAASKNRYGRYATAVAREPVPSGRHPSPPSKTQPCTRSASAYRGFSNRSYWSLRGAGRLRVGCNMPGCATSRPDVRAPGAHTRARRTRFASSSRFRVRLRDNRPVAEQKSALDNRTCVPRSCAESRPEPQRRPPDTDNSRA